MLAAVGYLSGAGVGDGDDLLGILFGLGATLFISGHLTILAARPDLDRLCVLMIGATTGIIVGAINSMDLTAALSDLFLLAVLGVFVVGGAFLLIGSATRILSAPEVALIMLLEMLLGPLWVWLAIGEEPASATILAGLVIAITIVVHSILGLHARKRGQRMERT